MDENHSVQWHYQNVLIFFFFFFFFKKKKNIRVEWASFVFVVNKTTLFYALEQAMRHFESN